MKARHQVYRNKYSDSKNNRWKEIFIILGQVNWLLSYPNNQAIKKLHIWNY